MWCFGQAENKGSYAKSGDISKCRSMSDATSNYEGGLERDVAQVVNQGQGKYEISTIKAGLFL
ncbi:MAG: hypothetical protein EBS66_11445 [Betaproteobacteria bacterium]|nr:hypothetical protein [Betaproteobacteria bacterium]